MVCWKVNIGANHLPYVLKKEVKIATHHISHTHNLFNGQLQVHLSLPVAIVMTKTSEQLYTG